MSTSSDDRQAVLDAILEIGRSRLGLRATPRLEDHLVRDVGLDSLQQLSLMVEIEDRFRIALDETDEASITTLGDLVDLVVRRRSHGGHPSPRRD